MRKLSNSEKEHLIQLLQEKTRKVRKIMKLFRLYGCILILAIVLSAVTGIISPSDLPYMIAGCTILYFVYFKLTGFLANQNQWMTLLNAIQKNKEFVFYGELLNTYTTRHGQKHGSQEKMGNIRVSEKEIRCRIDSKLMGNPPGTEVLIVCSHSSLENGYTFAIKRHYD